MISAIIKDIIGSIYECNNVFHTDIYNLIGVMISGRLLTINPVKNISRILLLKAHMRMSFFSWNNVGSKLYIIV